MEINAQQLEALLRLQEQHAQHSQRGRNADFEEILARQLDPDSSSNPLDQLAADASPAAMVGQILLNHAESQPDQDTAVLQAAFDQASGALALFDDYARTIGAGTGPTLRDAYSLLEGIDEKLAGMRQSAQALPVRNEGLNSLLNQLEIMTATEKFKFNRGDYLEAI